MLTYTPVSGSAGVGGQRARRRPTWRMASCSLSFSIQMSRRPSSAPRPMTSEELHEVEAAHAAEHLVEGGRRHRGEHGVLHVGVGRVLPVHLRQQHLRGVRAVDLRAVQSRDATDELQHVLEEDGVDGEDAVDLLALVGEAHSVRVISEPRGKSGMKKASPIVKLSVSASGWNSRISSSEIWI